MKKQHTFLSGFILAIVTLILYWPVTHYPFVVIDDDEYVTENPSVARGISLASLKWAFSSTHAANWHPLTWLSHMVDYSMYGPFAGGHHLTSLFLHTLNTLLVFLLLKTLTKSIWRSFVVAGLFGWHPLHVESVAWVAERKDVLSTFFFLLTLWPYARYAQRLADSQPVISRAQSPELKPAGGQPLQSEQPFVDSGLEHQKSKSKNLPTFAYCLALCFYALGLMCKPMLVTVPFVLLLLDFWPLQRLSFPVLQHPVASTLQWSTTPLPRLLWEKLPFFALSLGACVVTLVAQHAGGAVKSFDEVSLVVRLLNAPTAVIGYLVHTVYPAGLCVLYPLPKTPPVAMGGISTAVIGGVTWLFATRRSAWPWAVTGWLWFLGTLVPVLGLVQVGGQAMADRYTYIPSIGLFVLIVWSVVTVLKRWRTGQWIGVATALVFLIVCFGLARKQLRCWRDSVALCTHAVLTTKENAFAENDLGVALARQGDSVSAIQHYLEALQLNPSSAAFHYNLAVEFAAVGRADDAAFQFSEALKLNPRSEILHNNLGAVLAQQGKFESATEHFLKAMAINPDYPKPYLNYAAVLQRQGEAGAAVTNYAKALQLDGEWPDALQKFAFLLATCPDSKWRNPASAVRLAEHACALGRYQVPQYLATLATAYAAGGQFSNAISIAEMARQQALDRSDQKFVQKLDRELQSYKASQLPQLDWQNP